MMRYGTSWRAFIVVVSATAALCVAGYYASDVISMWRANLERAPNEVATESVEPVVEPLPEQAQQEVEDSVPGIAQLDAEEDAAMEAERQRLEEEEQQRLAAEEAAEQAREEENQQEETAERDLVWEQQEIERARRNRIRAQRRLERDRIVYTSTGRRPSNAGYLTLDSEPYATVYVDGERIGDTPIIRYAVRPGIHEVRVETAEGESRILNLRIERGKAIQRRLRIVGR